MRACLTNITPSSHVWIEVLPLLFASKTLPIMAYPPWDPCVGALTVIASHDPSSKWASDELVPCELIIQAAILLSASGPS